MNKRMIGIVVIIDALIIAVFAAAIILLNSKIDSMRLLEYRDVHLGEILDADIGVMRIGSYDYPNGKRSVTDEALRNELIEELRALISNGSFQRARGRIIGNKPGDAAFTEIYLTTADGKEFSLTAMGKAVGIATPYGNGWYYSNIKLGVQTIVWKAEQQTKAQEVFRSGAPRIASEESKKLALTAIDKLIEGNQDFSGVDMSSFSAEIVYSRACSLAPEIVSLEKRADGFLALLELYEEYAENACSYDWKALKQRRDRGLNDPGYAWRYEDPEGYKMKVFPQRIEGLFAQKPFFSKLDGSQQKRFFSALCYIYNTVTVPLEDYLDGTEDGCCAHFFFCGGGELLDEYEVCMENGKAVLKSLHTA